MKWTCLAKAAKKPVIACKSVVTKHRWMVVFLDFAEQGIVSKEVWLYIFILQISILSIYRIYRINITHPAIYHVYRKISSLRKTKYL
jgi:hypothetical protein